MPWALTQHVDKDAAGAYKPTGTIDTLLFIDGLKRVLQTKKDATVVEEGTSGAVDKMTVSGQVVFDAFGRTTAQHYPVTEVKHATGNLVFNPAVDAVAPTTTTYDVLDRVKTTTLPDGSLTTIAYQFGPGRTGTGTAFETIVTDANVNAALKGSVKHTYRDVRDLITSIKELTETRRDLDLLRLRRPEANQDRHRRQEQRHHRQLRQPRPPHVDQKPRHRRDDVCLRPGE